MFLEVYQSTFSQIFDLFMNYELVFPPPIGSITLFQIAMFFFVANGLAFLINMVVSRRGDDT